MFNYTRIQELHVLGKFNGNDMKIWIFKYFIFQIYFDYSNVFVYCNVNV